MSDSSRVQLYYLAENNWGQTPAAALNTLRGVTRESLKGTTDTTQSQEIRADRQVVDLVRTQFRAEGEIETEVSYGALDDLLEGAFFSDWVVDDPMAGQDTLENGSTFKSFTLEKQFADITQFVSYTGMVVDRFALTIRPGEIVTARLGFMGEDEAIQGTSVGTGAPTAPPTASPMNAVDHITLAQEGGVAANLLQLDVELANNLRAQPQLGDVNLFGVGTGRAVVTGSLEAYFETQVLYQKYLQQTESSLAVTLDDGSNSYALTLPRLKYHDGQVLAEGIDQDVLVRLQFTALRHTVDGITIRLIRTT